MRYKLAVPIKLISWKYTFKKLNEEYDLAAKKKHALDNLYETGKISAATRDSFTGDISAAIAKIEEQRKELAERMQSKTAELESQLKTLEMLLANYEIQHVVGEIDEDSYAREITLLTTSLQTTRNELEGIKQATIQLFPVETPIQTPAAPEPVATTAPEVAQAPVEAVPLEVPIETTPVESTPIIENIPVVEAAPIETAPAETPVVESAPAQIETPIETAPVEAAPVAAVPLEAPVEAPVEQATPEAQIETAPIEESAAIVETPAVEATPEVVTEAAQVIVEEAPVIVAEEAIPAEPTPLEATTTETPIAEEAPITEAAPVEIPSS